MKLPVLIISIICVIILVSSLTYVGLHFAFPKNHDRPINETDEVPIEITVADRIGFNVNTSKLFMGTAMPGGNSERSMTIFSHFDKNVSVTFYASGDVSGWVKVYPAEFILYPGARKDVNITVSPPKGTKFGNYSGTLIVSYKS